MAGTLEHSMTQSQQDFAKHVKPFYEALYKNSEIFSCEGDSHPLLQALDRNSGIDYCIVSNNPKQRFTKAIASRIQRAGMCYKTFTIRSKRDSGTMTEYTKTNKAICRGDVVSTLTHQGYVSCNGEELFALGIARTCDIWQFIKSYPNRVKTKHTHEDQFGQSEFLIIPWDDFSKVFSFMLVTPCEEGWRIDYPNQEKFKTTTLKRLNT